ncbi:MAG TPA: cation:proton antiporter [bacterium]|nr:cation:proton antiporter [bacterium]
MQGHYFIAYQLISLGILILAAIFGGRICRFFKINEEIGQLLGGLAVGPYFLNLFNYSNFYYQQSFESFKFVAFALLSLIAFSIGEELHLKRIAKAGATPIIIAITQALITWLIIFIFFQFLDFTLLDSLIIAVLGISTAPAAIFILLRKYNVEGQLKSLLTNVLVLCDIIEILLFAVFLEIKIMLYV